MMGLRPVEPAPYRLWINAERTVLVRVWQLNETMEVMLREHPDATWGPAIRLEAQP